MHNFDPGDGRAMFPLTSPQLDIWLDQQLNPQSPLYNIGGYMRVSGPIDAAMTIRTKRRRPACAGASRSGSTSTDIVNGAIEARGLTDAHAAEEANERPPVAIGRRHGRLVGGRLEAVYSLPQEANAQVST